MSALVTGIEFIFRWCYCIMFHIYFFFASGIKQIFMSFDHSSITYVNFFLKYFKNFYLLFIFFISLCDHKIITGWQFFCFVFEDIIYHISKQLEHLLSFKTSFCLTWKIYLSLYMLLLSII